MENANFTILCPCCEATLHIDRLTGAIVSHEEKGKKLGSFEELQQNLSKQKETRENLFAQSFNAEKDREHLLEDKFKEAMKRADETKDSPFVNPLDLD